MIGQQVTAVNELLPKAWEELLWLQGIHRGPKKIFRSFGSNPSIHRLRNGSRQR